MQAVEAAREAEMFGPPLFNYYNMYDLLCVLYVRPVYCVQSKILGHDIQSLPPPSCDCRSSLKTRFGAPEPLVIWA